MPTKPDVVKTFLASALSDESDYFDIADIDEWLDKKRKAYHFSVEPISFKELTQWHMDQQSGNLVHNSGRFFTIEGVMATCVSDKEVTWQQPIINQSEIGILGIITRVISGVRYFLMQSKMEPGNLGLVQLSPTVQATESNFSRVHQGKEPLYLRYFLDRTKSKILVDQLHSEQGGRFYRKRNRNIIVEVDSDIELNDDFCWLTLGQIKALLKRDNIVNLDSRSVLSCIPGFVLPGISNAKDIDQYIEAVFHKTLNNYFSRNLLLSMQAHVPTYRHLVDVVSWIAKTKHVNRLTTELIPLNKVEGWVIDSKEIRDVNNEFFSIIAVKVKAENREVSSWDQPLLQSRGDGLLGFITMEINGVLHFLVRAKVEAGNIDVVEIAPTVSCSNYKHKYNSGHAVPFLNWFMNASQNSIQYQSFQSEEGGRFYHLQNKNIVIQVNENSLGPIPDDFEWLSLYQMAELHKRGFLNIDTRTLLACLGVSNH